MRADRLIAALLLLQGRGRVTARELAEELEVSVGTARRDLEALSAAGIPVYPQPGRHGGWSLVGGARTDLTGLTAPEAQALFLLVGPAAAVSDEAKAALRKLVRALPSTFRSTATAAARSTIIDPARWGDRVTERPPMVELLQRAIVQNRKVRIVYSSPSAPRSERTIDPWGLVDKDEVWYLVAGTPRGRRTFRLDRILDAEQAEDSFERPDDFDLATAWDEIVGEMEERRSATWAAVLIPSRFVPILRDHFGQHCHVEEDHDDGRSRVRLGSPTPLDIARNLAGWGADVEVLEPLEVRAELHRIGSELAARYPPPGMLEP
ncbi:helix-turn-helix transcriptional regulator [Diaminobutyricimonas aerilata]|nr:YafY family protein [Diaminobutyricimonas aerilata]